jgi:hypothetical protein
MAKPPSEGGSAPRASAASADRTRARLAGGGGGARRGIAIPHEVGRGATAHRVRRPSWVAGP